MVKVYKIFINGLVTLIIILLTLYILLNIFIPKKTIDIIGFNFYNVSAESMSPKYNINDVIFVSKTNKSNLNEGDIITFIANVKEGDRLKKVIITHYIGNITTNDNKTLYQTQSHNNYHQKNNMYDIWYNETGDELLGITSDQILGKSHFRIPYIGYIMKLLSIPFIYITLSGAILLIYVSKCYKNRKEAVIKPNN